VYPERVADDASLEDALEEIRARLAWVRDYL
jgi:hypothetical protein